MEDGTRLQVGTVLWPVDVGLAIIMYETTLAAMADIITRHKATSRRPHPTLTCNIVSSGPTSLEASFQTRIRKLCGIVKGKGSLVNETRRRHLCGTLLSPLATHLERPHLTNVKHTHA